MSKKKGRCVTHKTAYPTQEAAADALHEIWKHPHTSLLPCRTYQCHICGEWHLTSKPFREDLTAHCVSGARRFATEEFAESTLKSIQKYPKKDYVPERVEHCDDCEGWHLRGRIDVADLQRAEVSPAE